MSNYYAKPLRETIEWAVSCNGDEPRKSIDELVAEVKFALEAEDRLLWQKKQNAPAATEAFDLPNDEPTISTSEGYDNYWHRCYLQAADALANMTVDRDNYARLARDS